MENIDRLFYERSIKDEELLKDSSLGIQDRSCRVYEVGGRRAERMSWRDVDKNADSVIFVVSMTGYSQAVPGYVTKNTPSWFREPMSQNQMLESLKLFGDITRVPEFRTIPILLLLNKLDLLAQRIWKDPIANYFPGYSGDSDPLAACRFFAAKFLDLDNRPKGNLKVVVASAVDTHDFNCTLDEILPEVFEEGPAADPAEEGEEGNMGKDEEK